MSNTTAAIMVVKRSIDWYKSAAYLVIEKGKKSGIPNVVR